MIYLNKQYNCCIIWSVWVSASQHTILGSIQHVLFYYVSFNKILIYRNIVFKDFTIHWHIYLVTYCKIYQVVINVCLPSHIYEAKTLCKLSLNDICTDICIIEIELWSCQFSPVLKNLSRLVFMSMATVKNQKK